MAEIMPMTMMIRTGFPGRTGSPRIWNASASTPRWNADMSARLPSGLLGGIGCAPKRQRGIPHDACYVSWSGGGGAYGALLRYVLSLLIGAGFFGIAGPMETLSVNIGGSAMMGLLTGGMAAGLVLPEPLRLFIDVGFLGALTTFSSFALDAGSLLAFGAAHMLAGMLFGRDGG